MFKKRAVGQYFEASKATLKFFGQSYGQGRYPPIYQQGREFCDFISTFTL